MPSRPSAGPSRPLRGRRRTSIARWAGSAPCGRYGQKAAAGRRVGWSRQHVTTLANAYRAGELDQEERTEAA